MRSRKTRTYSPESGAEDLIQTGPSGIKGQPEILPLVLPSLDFIFMLNLIPQLR